jgi:hypothetical protein
MKRLILLGSALLVLASGCNKASTVSSTQPFGIPPTPQTSTSTPPAAAQTSPTNTTSTTPNLKTYTNSQYNFQVQYPELSSKDQEIVTQSAGGNADVSFQYWDPTSSQYSDSFDFFINNTNNSNDTLEQWFEKNVDVNSILLKANTYPLTNIQGGQIMVFNGTTPEAYYSAPGAGPSLYTAYIMPNSKKYILRFGESQGDPMNLQPYETQILSSFKFTQN